MILGEDGAGEEAGTMDRLNEVLAMAGSDILTRIGTGHISPAAYDTGWVARIADPEGAPEFPETLDWLVANQREDGSWGSEVFHEYDRFINTLSAAIALKQWGNHPEALERAEAYLRLAIQSLAVAREGVSSDHLVGLLIEEAQRVGIDLPYESSPHKPWGQLKRTLLSMRYIDPEHPLGFFSELLGRAPNPRRVSRILQRENGSIMCSPSATAASIVFNSNVEGDHVHYDKLRYLKSSIQPDGGVRHFWDLETMERAYGLYNLLHAEPRSSAYIEQILKLQECWMPTGLGFGRHYPVADLDDTALGYRLLTHAGKEPDPHVFDRFWRGEFFVTYTVHDRGQHGPNIHALEAIAHSSHPEKDEIISTTVKWLRSQMVDQRYFLDEWHLSPAYPTAHAIPAFHLTEEALMDRCVSFFLETQHEDGSWGYAFGNGLGTVEETAFALQGLLYYHHNVEPIDESRLTQGLDYILANYPTANLPEMWMAKVLNTPTNIVHSLVIGSLLMFKRFVGGDYSDPL